MKRENGIRQASRLLLLCLLAWLSAGCAAPETAPAPPSPPDVSAQVQQYRETFLHAWDSLFQARLLESGCPGAAVVIVQDSTTLLAKGYGLRQAGAPEPVDAHTRFRIASVSKGFAGVLTGMLTETGVLSPQDRVQDILPGFMLRDSAQAARIRIWHLLSHSTGLPRHTFTGMVEGAEDRAKILSLLPTVELGGTEGQFFAYQNFAFSLIEEIIQQRTGSRYTDLLETRVFQPAGMADAAATVEAWRAAPNRALPHFQNRAGEWIPEALNEKYFAAPSAGGITASATDMGQWLKVLLGCRPDIAGNAALDTAFAPRVETNSRHFVWRWDGALRSRYGLGWRVIDLPGGQVVCHGGNVNQYRSEIALDRAHRIGICFLFNAPAAYQGTAPARFFQMLAAYRKALGGL